MRACFPLLAIAFVVLKALEVSRVATLTGGGSGLGRRIGLVDLVRLVGPQTLGHGRWMSAARIACASIAKRLPGYRPLTAERLAFSGKTAFMPVIDRLFMRPGVLRSGRVNRAFARSSRRLNANLFARRKV